MRTPDLKSTLIAAAIGGFAVMIINWNNLEKSTAFQLGAITGAIVQIGVRILKVS
jgi:hypothetical protein